MTLIVGAVVSQGIVIAGDRRVTAPLAWPGRGGPDEDISRKVGLVGSRYIHGTSGRAFFDGSFTTQKIESLDIWAPASTGPKKRRIHGLAKSTATPG